MLGLLDTVDDVLVEPFVPYRAVVSLDVSVLLRLEGKGFYYPSTHILPAFNSPTPSPALLA